ncbi:MAG: tyrosine-type recombinase/integrase [Planctomycetota bacterium]|jgi:integrase
MSKVRGKFGEVFQRPGRKGWYLRFSFGGARYVRYCGPKKSIAEQKRAAAHALLAGGVSVEEVLAQVFGDFHGLRLTFRDAIEPYLEYAKDRKRASTYKRDVVRLETLKAAPWTKLYLAKIGREHIAAHIARRLAGGVAASTVNREVSLVGALFRWAQQRGYVKENPVRLVDKPSERDSGREVYLDADEVRALVAAAPAEFAPLLVCAFSTGMRRAEMMTLRWRAVDLDAGTLTVEPENAKTGHGRVIPLTDTLAAVLGRLWAELKVRRIDRGDYVFVAADGEPWRDWTVRQRFEKTKAGCEGIDADKLARFRLHDARHTAASLMVAKGIPLFDVSKILGHSSVSMTMRYAHFAPEAGRAAIAALGEALAFGT